MENKNDTVEVEETINNDIEEVEAKDEPVVPEKPPIVETAEAKRARLMRQLKKVNQQLGIAEEEVDKPQTKPFSLDRADKAFLNANNIRGKDEYDLVSDFASNTGKDIEDIIESKYFQSELTNLRATRESKLASDATSGGNRSGNSPSDTVEYWVAKNKLPPPYMKQLRRDVVNRMAQIDSNSGTFSDTPVIGQ